MIILLLEWVLCITNTASGNTAVGKYALHANTSGTRNIAIGFDAYNASDTENDNLAIGYDAMTTNTAGGTRMLQLVTILDALTSGDIILHWLHMLHTTYNRFKKYSWYLVDSYSTGDDNVCSMADLLLRLVIKL